MKNLKTQRLNEQWFYKDTKKSFTIIEYIDSKTITIRFDDYGENDPISNLEINGLTYRVIENMLFKLPINKFTPTIYNIGYIGNGKYKFSENGKHTKAYNIWHSMLKRCYSKNKNIEFPAYINCSVYPSWHNFQNFANWFEQNYIEDYYLDKDILLKGNTIYSEYVCCFVPIEISNLLVNSIRHNKIKNPLPVGITFSDNGFISSCSLSNGNKSQKWFKDLNQAFENYKSVKESVILKVAEEFKTKIPLNVYNALISRRINFDD